MASKSKSAAPGTAVAGQIRSTMSNPFGGKKGAKRAIKRGPSRGGKR